MWSWGLLGPELSESPPVGWGTARGSGYKFAHPQASLFFLCIFYRLLRKYACEKESLGIFQIKLQFNFCSELSLAKLQKWHRVTELALFQGHRAHAVPSFSIQIHTDLEIILSNYLQ